MLPSSSLTAQLSLVSVSPTGVVVGLTVQMGPVAVEVAVDVTVEVGVDVAVRVGEGVAVSVAVKVDVAEFVAVAVPVGTRVTVEVVVDVAVAVGAAGEEGPCRPGQPRMASNGRTPRNIRALRMGPLGEESAVA